MLTKRKRYVDKKLLQEIKQRLCAACGGPGCDPAHIKSVGSGGPDREWNVISMCRECHTLQHKSGWIALMAKRPYLRVSLRARGWTWEGGRMWNPLIMKDMYEDLAKD